MVAMSSPKISQKLSLLENVKPFLEDITLVAGDTFLWSPKDKVVQYQADRLKSKFGQWSLLHEIAHGRLNHHSYASDFELLQLEVDAWNEAKKLSRHLTIDIDPHYVEDCLDTYRDWLHQRSTCPTCGSVGLQHDAREYRCHNCLTTWHVSESRFCRPYRMKQASRHRKKSSERDQTTFQ
jgi:hypothetical protein